jgi:hypothetical protein
MRRGLWFGVLASLASASGCGTDTSTPDTIDSEVSVGVVSGAISEDSAGVALNMPRERKTRFQRILDELKPIRDAYAATFTCSGDTLSPAFSGPGRDPYAFTPVSCSITWGNGKTASSTWSGTFTLNYGTSCDNIHARLVNQAASCSITRTTATGGNTRTLTGPNGNAYSITHDTNGAGTGWDSSVTPAPTNGGVMYSCGAAGCSGSKTLVINGSHLTGTVTPNGGQARTVWNHTVSTGASGVTVTGTGTNRVVNGTVTTQHNILKYTATTTFNNVGYGQIGCCFPTTGSVSTTFSTGTNLGKTETLTFSSVCGEATVTLPNGKTIGWTLQHCL